MLLLNEGMFWSENKTLYVPELCTLNYTAIVDVLMMVVVMVMMTATKQHQQCV